MLIKEYRITMPLSLGEYQMGQLYTTLEASKDETGGGEGIELLVNERFSNCSLANSEFRSGQFTRKIIHLGQKIPSSARFLLPKNGLKVLEEAWNAYPYCRTVVTNPGYMKDKFNLIIESFHLADRGDTENIHRLPPEKLKVREVVKIDIADPLSSYNKYDPSKFHSTKTGRGPLTGNWQERVEPVMTCYKLVTVEFKWFGLQSSIERLIHRAEKRIFTTFHKQLFCLIDNWIDITMDEIRTLEINAIEELDRARASSKSKGTPATEYDK